MIVVVNPQYRGANLLPGGMYLIKKSHMKIFRTLTLALVVVWCTNIMLLAQTKHVLILYDTGLDKNQPGLIAARFLNNLLNHFDVKTDLLPIKDYKNGDLKDYDLAFYMNYEKKLSLPFSFISDFCANDKTFCWLNSQINQVGQDFLRRKYGFHCVRYSENLGFDRISYKGEMFPKGYENLNLIQIDNPETANVISYAYDKQNNKTPYIIHSKNLWCVGDSPFAYSSETDTLYRLCRPLARYRRRKPSRIA